MTDTAPELLAAVRRALGRTEPLREAPVPPPIPEHITRLVHSEVGLAELFARRAAENKMGVQRVPVEELLPALSQFLTKNSCKSIALARSPLLDKLDVLGQLQSAGFDARPWGELTLDQLYDFDCAITDVWRAVAETGSLVVRARVDNDRALSLVPPMHVAILEPRNYIADLTDLFDALAADPDRASTVIITGPSKTSDIEMTLVTGVHGPCVVQLFLLS